MKALPALAAGVMTVLAGSGCQKEEITTYRVAKEPVPAAQPATPSPATPSPAAAPTGSSAGGSSMASTPVATTSGNALSWTAPAGWTAKPAGSMRKGSYAVKGDGGEADMAVTAFPGDVGGDLANLNRWRGQIGLAPVDQAEFDRSTRHLDRNGLHMTFVDIVGTGANAQRILGAMVPHQGSTWFLKLTGPDALVARERDAFLALLDTVKPAAPAK
ncbi:MAG: hypothetical protein RLZZ188_1671 [Verrucomicrobiota bacterium]